MDILFRHTILSQVIHLGNASVGPFADDQNPATLKSLVTLQDAQSLPSHAGESTALLTDGEEEYGHGTLLVDWYSADDPDVGPSPPSPPLPSLLAKHKGPLLTGQARTR